MKEEFYSKIDGYSTTAKIEALFKNVDFYHYQFVHAKRRLDLFRKMPLLDLLFNHYKLYQFVFMIVGALLNLLIFASFYRTNDDFEVVEEYSEDFKFDYGFLYKHKNSLKVLFNKISLLCIHFLKNFSNNSFLFVKASLDFTLKNVVFGISGIFRDGLVRVSLRDVNSE